MSCDISYYDVLDTVQFEPGHRILLLAAMAACSIVHSKHQDVFLRCTDQ